MARRVFHPAVVVGDDADGRISHLRFTREERFGHVGHADEVAARLPQEVAFGTRAESRPFDAGIGQVPMQGDAEGPGRRRRGVDERGAHRRGGRDMRGHTGAEEGAFAAATGPVEVLRRHGQLAGRDLFRQAAHRRKAEQHRGTGALERKDVGAVVHLMRQQPVPRTMPSEEQDLLAADAPAHDRTGRCAERRGGVDAGFDVHPGQVVQAGAADDCKHGVQSFEV